MRITRCRIRVGHSVENARHVSFSARILGEKAENDVWSSMPSNQIGTNRIDANTMRSASSPPHLSDIARWRCASVGSSGTCRPRRKQYRVDARLKKWIPADTSGTGRRESRRHDIGARRADTQHNNDALESTSSGSSTSSETDPLEVKLASGVSKSWSNSLPHGRSVSSLVTWSHQHQYMKCVENMDTIFVLIFPRNKNETFSRSIYMCRSNRLLASSAESLTFVLEHLLGDG